MSSHKQVPTLRDYERRDDLCADHQAAVYYLQDYGSVVQVKGRGWWCTNDCRISLVGIEPNERLAQPTLGPFKTAAAASQARERLR